MCLISHKIRNNLKVNTEKANLIIASRISGTKKVIAIVRHEIIVLYAELKLSLNSVSFSLKFSNV